MKTILPDLYINFAQLWAERSNSVSEVSSVPNRGVILPQYLLYLRGSFYTGTFVSL